MRAYLSVFTDLCSCITYVLQTVTFTVFWVLQLGMKKALKQKLQGLKEFSSDEAAYALETFTSKIRSQRCVEYVGMELRHVRCQHQ